jgi:UDP-N-acetylglucosamine--N-acetylmuramyl-(pentapeptide) pyrophosphoryl-undecaprenol N-acetylglucosamine transferase
MLFRRPDLVVGAGGYASGPAVLAAVVLGVRTMILEQNDFPGATNRWLAPRVDLVCLPSETARDRIGGHRLVTGNPVRAAFFDVPDAVSGPELSLLVVGGSRGARSINRAMTESLSALARLDPPPRIVHQTGVADETVVREAYAAYPAGRAEVTAFIDDMPDRLTAADLVVGRAGASTLAELTAAGRPAILVPYPHAADDHQRHNAESLRDAGAAVVVPDDELGGGRLGREISDLARDPERRRIMASAARGLARRGAAARIADAAQLLMHGKAPREIADVS